MPPPSLSDFVAPTRPVSFRGNVIFYVSGLSLDDFTWLINLHRDDILKLVEAYDEQKSSIFSTAGFDRMIGVLIGQFPNLAAEMIACGARQREFTEVAAQLPATTQIAALAEIMGQTFDDAGGLKNLSATLAMLGKNLFPDDLRATLESRLPQLLKNV